MSTATEHGKRSWLFRLLRVRVWLAEVFSPSELQVTLFWAGVIGFIGALTSMSFRGLAYLLHLLLTQQGSGYVESFRHLAWWERLLVPAFGGLIAGAILHASVRFARAKSSTDYMEAIVVGTGVLPARFSLIKCASALFSIASGASIGREGPLVQLSSLCASLIGRACKMPAQRLRLLVACGASAGIASAYNAPISGAMFISEIVLGSIAMESFGPLVFSSVIATITLRQTSPLYEISMPANAPVHANSEIVPCMLLGLLAGALGPAFLKLLRWSEKLFAQFKLPPYQRLPLGGLVVGALAIVRPEVCGNGYSVVEGVLKGHWMWQPLLLVLALKLLATSATFGSGAVGGVFTPTLFVGACVGYIFEHLIQPLWPWPLDVSLFALVGMGAFLASTTHAPIMAILLLFELTLDYPIILPLMLACVLAHYTSLSFIKDSIYSESLKRKGADAFQRQLRHLRVSNLMKADPPAVREIATFRIIAQNFLKHRFNFLYVTGDNGSFRGAIALHDIKSYLSEPELANIVIARDLLDEAFPTLTPDMALSEALMRFSHISCERLPVTDVSPDHKLIGSLSKTDLIMALTERASHQAGPK